MYHQMTSRPYCYSDLMLSTMCRNHSASNTVGMTEWMIKVRTLTELT
jgi:hypothetical protein